MSCFDVVYQPSSSPYSGYLTCQRSISNSPLKKRCRFDTEAHPVITSASSDSMQCKRSGLSCNTSTTTGPKVATHSATSTANASRLGHSTISTERPTFSSAPPTSSSSTSSLISSSSVVTLKSEMTSAENDDELQPVMTQQMGGNSILLTYFSEDIDTNIDNHFHRALSLSQQTAARFSASLTAAGPDNKSQTSSCCRQDSSPLSQRSFPASFWNTMSSCSSSSTASTAYRPSNRPTGWSSLMVSSPKTDSLAAAFTVSTDPVDPYAHHLNFPSAAAGAASPTGALGSLHHPQDPWHAYAFGPPPPPPPQASPSTYRRYRHSVHEFSFSAADAPFSGGNHFASGMRGYKSFLHGHRPPLRNDPKPHSDFWRSRCYGFSDMPGSHLAAGFTLAGGIEVSQTNLPDTSVKDVYWF